MTPPATAPRDEVALAVADRSAEFAIVANRLVTFKSCACGCGTSVTERDARNRPRRFIWGHNGRLRVKKVDVCYEEYHARVQRARGKPSHCEDCGTTDSTKRYEWASISRNYGDIYDYKRLCKKCHNTFDEIAKRTSIAMKGRPGRKGMRHPRARLSNDDVLEIRQRRASGQSYDSLSSAFGVSAAHISRIVLRQSWGHVA